MRTEQNKSAEDETASAVEIEPVVEEPVTACNQNEAGFWRSIGLPYCDKCCSPRRTDERGQTLCTLSLPTSKCPLQQ